MIKLIITDVDDTVAHEGSQYINPEYYEVIHALREKGVIFVVASGRQRQSIQKTFQPVSDEIIYIADNGTDIYSKEFETSLSFPQDEYEELIKDLHALGGEYQVMSCKPLVSYIEEGCDAFFDKMKNGYGYVLEKTKNAEKLEGICKISLYNPKGIEEEVEMKMKERWSGSMDVCIAGQWYLDFTGKGANKGKALSIIQEHYGITAEETAAFGNADNDISMLVEAKHSYAVANASEGLKAVASEVIGSMEEDAVLDKLKEFLSLV